VTLTKSTEDRRRGMVRLTPRGRRLATTMSPLIRDANEQAMSDLTEAEIRTFKRLYRPNPANAQFGVQKSQ